MITLSTMTIGQFLKEKHLALQVEQRRVVSQTEFAALFGTDQPTISQIMKDKRPPSSEVKQRIIDYYGDEAVMAFGEDPDIYYLTKDLELLTPKELRDYRIEIAEKAATNEAKRSHQKPRTRKAD